MRNAIFFPARWLLCTAVSLGSLGTLRAAPLNIHASIPPVAWFVEAIGGEYVNVSTLIGPGDDPHTFQPRPSMLRDLSSADLWVQIGIEFEEHLIPRLGDAKRQMVSLREGFPLRRFGVHAEASSCCEKDGAHEHDHEHEHGPVDPHIWLSPEFGLHAITVIENAILERLGDQASMDAVQERAKQTRLTVQGLVSAIGGALQETRGGEVVVFHPSFGYFGDAFGIRQVAIESSGRAPRPRQLRELVSSHRVRKGGVVLFEPGFPEQRAKAIAEAFGGEPRFVDHLAPDWPEMMLDVADAFSQSKRDSVE